MYTEAGVNNLLDGLLITHVGLHSDFPGENGDHELSGGGYARQPIAFPEAANRLRTWTGALNFSVPAGRIAWISLWEGATMVCCLPNGGLEREVTRISVTGVLSCPNHNYAVGDPVVLTGDVPVPFVAWQVYYVSSANSTEVALSETPGGPPIGG